MAFINPVHSCREVMYYEGLGDDVEFDRRKEN